MLMPTALPLAQLENAEEFVARHIGVDEADEQHMLSVIGAATRRALIEAIVPRSIERARGVALPPGSPRRRRSPSCARSPGIVPVRRLFQGDDQFGIPSCRRRAG